MKTEVYSWRISSATKGELETEARTRGITVAALLDKITGEWIESARHGDSGEDVQARLHSSALKTVGTIAGKNRKRAERAAQLLRKRLKRRYAR